MHDDVRRMIDARRVKTTALPEGLSTAPILDTWEFRPALPVIGAPPSVLKLAGRISGDQRFPAGEAIFTSSVEEVDGRSSIRWARARNTLYRLGSPALEDQELAIAEGLWRGGSVRRLRAIVERILARREQDPRH